MIGISFYVFPSIHLSLPTAGKWRRLPPMPTPRCGCCAVGTKTSVVVLAGQLANGTVLDKARRNREWFLAGETLMG